MRTRLGAHAAGLLAAAASPLDADDLARLTGRSAARMRTLLPTSSTPDIAVTALDADGSASAWELRGGASVARVIRNLHAGPLPAGAADDPEMHARALAPFRAALHASVRSAREEWGWEGAPAFALSPGFARSLQTRAGDRRALIALVTDPGRARALDAHHPDAAREQWDEAVAHVASVARTPGDLVDLARLLVAASGWEQTGGAVPRRLAPVFALVGDTERAAALAGGVRTDPAIERAYVARAAAQAGDPAADRLLDEALDGLGDAPRGALLRTAQAVAGTALFLEAPSARRAAASARDLVERAFTDDAGPAAVEGLRARQFRSSRDEEWALAGRILATCAVARSRSGCLPALERTVREARGVLAEIGDPARRALAEADAAARLAERAAEPTGRAERAALAAGIDGAAEAALDCPDDPTALGEIARLLSGRTDVDGDTPEAPAPDPARAARAAERALALVVSSGATPPPRLLRDAAALGLAAAAVDAARATVDTVAAARHATSLERRARARGEAVALADAAVVLSGAGHAEEALAAARGAWEAAGRIPSAARARWLAEVAAALLVTDDDALFAQGVLAADAVHTGAGRAGAEAGAHARWDAKAPTLLADALLTGGREENEASGKGAEAEPGTGPEAGSEPEPEPALKPGSNPAPGPGSDAETTPGLGAAARRATRRRILDDAVTALRRAESASGLTLLADRAARIGATETARRLAVFALRAAHVVDPVRRERAAAALRASAAASGPASAAASGTPSELDLAALAQRWRADGYPDHDLVRFTAAHPSAGRRVAALIRADLDR